MSLGLYAMNTFVICYISFCPPIIGQVLICISFIESGCIISNGNEQPLRQLLAAE